MSKPRYYWYGTVKKMIMRYPQMKDNNKQEKQYIKAVEKALEDTNNLDLADARLKAIDFVLFKQTLTPEGAALHLNYERRNIDRWISKFVYMVGMNVGFPSK